MIAVPREVSSIQSPWRHTPGYISKYASRRRAPSGSFQKHDRHRRQRLRDHELADLVDDGRGPARRTPARRSRATAPAARPRRRATAARRRRTPCRRRSRRSSRTATCRRRARRRPSESPPATAASRSSRRCASALRSRPAAGLTLSLHAARDERGARAEARDLRLGRELPQAIERRLARRADCRRRGRSTPGVSSTPTRKFHIIQPVVVNQKMRSPSCASRCRLSFLRCSSRIPPWPWTIAFGSPVVPLEYRTHSGWSKGDRRRARSPSPCAPEEAILPAAPVEVAEAHERPADLGVDLRDDGASGRGRARRSGSRRRRAGPSARSARSGR